MKEEDYRRCGKIWSVTKEVFETRIAESHSMKELLATFGLAGHGNNYLTIERRARIDNIDLSDMKQRSKQLTARQLTNYRRTRSLKEILVANSDYTNTSNLKKRLIDKGILKNECYSCGQEPIWKGKPLVLQLEHKNGKGKDHRRCNLEILCPNCHGQTKTFCGKNK